MRPFAHRIGLVHLAVVVLTALGGCAHQPRPAPRDVYGAPPPAYPGRGPVPSVVQYGHVRSIEQIEGGRGEASGAGALVGGVVGAVVGRQVGSGSGRAAATALGAVGGAIVGNEIERQRSAPRGLYEVQVEMERGGGEQWFQLERLDGLKVGDRVRIDNGRLQRW